jgi:PmbA protein
VNDREYRQEHLETSVREALESATAAGADAAEAMSVHSSTRQIHYRDREKETVSLAEASGIGLRVVHGGKMGFAWASGTGSGELRRLAVRAVTSARLGEDPAHPLAGKAVSPACVGTVDPAIEARPDGVKHDFLREQVEHAFALSPLVEKIHRLSLSERLVEKALATTTGFDGHKRGTWYSLSASVVAARGEDREMAHEWRSVRTFADLQEAGVSREAAARALALLGGTPVPTGVYAVVLSPETAVTLLSLFCRALSGEAVSKGKSPLAGKLGRRVASTTLSLVDDGLLAGGYGSEPFDDEGIPQSRRQIVEGGVLASYFLTLRTAHLLSLAPTGHAQRGDFRSPPGAGPANAQVVPDGSHPTQADLLRAMGRGLLVVDVMGAHTLDLVSGAVSLGASGFVVEGGQVGRPFRGITLAGNLYQLLERVAAVGGDLRFYGEMGSPSLLVEGVDVAGSAT